MTDSTALERLHRLATTRGLAEVERSTAAGAPALTVAGTVFVRLLDEDTALLECPVDQKVLLIEISPDIYFETERFVGQDCMLLHLSRIDDEELSLRLHDAWTFKAPAGLRKS